METFGFARMEMDSGYWDDDSGDYEYEGHE